MDKRFTWTDQEIMDLKSAYDREKHALELPQHLIDSHGKSACWMKAKRMGISNKFVKKRLKMHEWSDVELSYLAGIIDGEGCICFTNRGNGKSYKITINTTSTKLFKWLRKLDRGCSYQDNRKLLNPKHKPVWTFCAGAYNDVLEILEHTEPYMIIKKDKAKKAINWLKEKTSNNLT